MKPELERASRALVALVSAGCVSWWLWPTEPGEARIARERAVEIVPVVPVVEPAVEPAAPLPPPPSAPEAAPMPALDRPVLAAPKLALPAITATARAAPRRAAPEPARMRGELSEGRLPRLQGSTHRIGFAAYRDAMLALGGGFFLYDASAKQLLAEIDPMTGEIRSGAVRPGLSDWPRDFTRYFEVALALGQKRYGVRASRVVLLPPAAVDSALVVALQRDLPPLGVDVDAVVRVDLVYALRSGRLECDVVGVGLRDAADRALELRITLSDPIPGLSYLTSREEIQHA